MPRTTTTTESGRRSSRAEHGSSRRWEQGCRCDTCTASCAPTHAERLPAALRLDPDDERHGTPYGYNRGKCRCDRCRAAYAEFYQSIRAARLAEMQANRRHRYHGTTAGYSLGCRCKRCLAARTGYLAARSADAH